LDPNFSTFDVVKILNIQRERLREWIKEGFVSPTTPAEGIGTKALFSVLDLYKIAVFTKLIDVGMNRRRAAEWVNSNPRINNREGVKDLSYIVLFVDQKGGKWISCLEPGPWDISNTMSEDLDWSIGIMINFRKMKEEVESAIKLLG